MRSSLFISKCLRKTGIIPKVWLEHFYFELRKRSESNHFRIPIIRNISWNNIFDKEPWMDDILRYRTKDIAQS